MKLSIASSFTMTLSLAIVIGVNTKKMEDFGRNADFDHEAILGSKAEAEAFDHLPPGETKRRLEKLLEKMDVNMDKIIGKKELHDWIVKSLHSLYEEDVAEHFKTSDKDRNGSISWEEYRIGAYGDSERESHFLHEELYAFQAADKDGSQTLSMGEFRSFLHPSLDVEMPKLVLKQVLSHKDVDKDNRLSIKEYLGDQTSKEWADYERERFINELDKNEDNYLSGREIVDWIIPNGVEDVANEEVKHLFSEADGNKDELLHFPEILKNVELFVGSGATKYGNHLKNDNQNNNHFKDEL